jgi:hypothetical protein
VIVMRRFAVPPSALFVLAAILAGGEARAQDEGAPPVASAPPAASPTHFELFARGGYMTTPVGGGVTPFGFGGGAGLGLSIGAVYVGASVVDYAGASDDAGTSEHALLYGGEVGGNARAAPWLTLRPFVGAGGASITHSMTTSVALSTSATGARRASAPDVITQATSIGGGGGGGSGGLGGGVSTSDTTTATYYVEPGLAAIVSTDSGA